MGITSAGLLAKFARLNPAIWPMQVVAYLMVLAALFLVARKFKYSDRIVAAILAFFWIWNALVFFLPATSALSYILAAAFIVQGILFLVGVAKPSVAYRFGMDIFSLTGIVLILYALIGYPLVGYAIGHIYPRAVFVGTFPCPTAVVTFGLFLCTESKVPKYLLVIPLLFALFGILLASVGMGEDVGMVVGGLLATAMIVYRDRTVMRGAAYHPV